MTREWTDLIDVDAPSGDFSVIDVLHAAVLLVLARAALLTIGFQRTAKLVDRFSRTDSALPAGDHAPVDMSMRVVSLAAAFVPARLLCLERSLVLYCKLKRQSVPVVLRLGVRAYPFAAHAWVELESNPINEIPDRLKDFDPIFELGR